MGLRNAEWSTWYLVPCMYTPLLYYVQVVLDTHNHAAALMIMFSLPGTLCTVECTYSILPRTR